MILRKAQSHDCRIIYDIRTDSSVLEASLNTASFSYEHHKNWFEKSLKNPNRRIFVADDGTGTVLGVVRFDIEGNSEALVSIFLHPDHRGKGVGTFILAAGGNLLKKEFPAIASLKALIKKSNMASVKLFIKVGYVDHGDSFRFTYPG